VTTPGGTATSAQTYTVILPPTVSSFTPTSAVVGTTVTLTGTNLSLVDTATLNGSPVPIAQHVSATQLKVTLPDDATTGKFQVTNVAGTSPLSASTFKVIPRVDSFSVDHGVRTDQFDVIGHSFTGVSKVTINNVSAPFTFDSDTKLIVTVPNTATTGKVAVTTPSGTGTSAGSYTVILPPTISSFTPTSGPVGTTVTLTGTNLSLIDTATLNGAPVTIAQLVSATQLKVTLPDDATTGKFQVTNVAGTSPFSTSTFKVLPKITGFTPSSGAIGSAVKIDGFGFTGATSVKFGSVAAPSFSVDSPTSIATTVPTGAKTGKITVTTPSGSAVSASSFTVTVAPAAKVLKVNLSGGDVDSVDPGLSFYTPAWQLLHAVCANLVTSGPTGAPQPEVAASLPDVSGDGKTYTFTLRHDFRFSPPSNQVVTAQAFANVFDRLKTAAFQSPAVPFIGNISNVVADDADTLTITLARPDGALLSLLTTPWFCALPPTTPATQQNSFASAGPYYVASRTVGGPIVLKRNPNYAGSRTVTFDEIDYAVNTNFDTSLQQVKDGTVDFDANGVPTSAIDNLFTTYGPGATPQRFFVDPSLETDYLALNTSRGPFQDVRLRKAVNFALDRAKLVAQYASHSATATDQLLPPGMPGFSDSSIYPLSGPDLTAANAALPPGFSGATVQLYTSSTGVGPLIAQRVKTDLAAINITVQIQSFSSSQVYVKCGTKIEAFDICNVGWGVDYPDPVDFLQLLDGSTIQDTGNNDLSYFNDATFNQRLADASPLTGATRFSTYGQIDIDAARDAAPLAPFANRNAKEFFSSRIGCETYLPTFGSVDLASLCLRP
jgi:ABC-type transport system substrate-binding protein/uncharacterized protein YvpB